MLPGQLGFAYIMAKMVTTGDMLVMVIVQHCYAMGQLLGFTKLGVPGFSNDGAQKRTAMVENTALPMLIFTKC